VKFKREVEYELVIRNTENNNEMPAGEHHLRAAGYVPATEENEYALIVEHHVSTANELALRAARIKELEEQLRQWRCSYCQSSTRTQDAKEALRELIHVSNLHLPDGSSVELQVEFLRPRLALIRKALLGP
jgi:hypothetical protein